MVTDNQVRRLFRLLNTEKTLSVASAKAGMDVKTARRYKQKRRLPSELKVQHTWRADRFRNNIGVWGIKSHRGLPLLFKVRTTSISD